MKKIIIAIIALLSATTTVVAIANHQLVKEDKAFVASGGKIKGCDSLQYKDGIVCIKAVTLAQQ